MGNAYEFLGIPFAMPPLGPLRWMRPQPPANWTGVREATQYQASCAQSANGLAPGNISEDCLYLNVYVPLKPSTPGPLPVQIFFYGGSWSWGGASFFLYNAADYMQNSQDIILVTCNYRLEAFGFAASPLLAAEDPLGSTGNYGMQDQRAAMQWIVENIAAFGGNPNRLTISGESAGAGSVSFHLTAPASWPYFHGAIMESGPPANWTAVSLDLAEAHWQRMVTVLGCASSDGALELACMRAQSMQALINNQENANNALVAWSPVVDGVELTDIPPQLVRQGLFNHVPVLLGSNHDEGTLLISGLNPPATAQQLYDWINSTVGYEWADQVIAMYPVSEYPSPWWTGVRLFGDVAMSCPVRRNARWIANASVPAFVYFYTHVLDVVEAVPNLGVFHGSELLMVFDTRPLLLPSEQTLALTFEKYWSNFVVYGNPNGDGSVPLTWPQYSYATDSNMNLDLQLSVDVGLKGPECDLWDQIYYAEHPL